MSENRKPEQGIKLRGAEKGRAYTCKSYSHGLKRHASRD